MSTHLQWILVGNCLSFLIKRNKQNYSTESTNLKALGPAADCYVPLWCLYGGIATCICGNPTIAPLYLP
uniref:Uncharacterized protein n=1 Tax=Salvator merianae TaxID=96440 RepID=A0A8D0DV98_SALMN